MVPTLDNLCCFWRLFDFLVDHPTGQTGRTLSRILQREGYKTKAAQVWNEHPKECTQLLLGYSSDGDTTAFHYIDTPYIPTQVMYGTTERICVDFIELDESDIPVPGTKALSSFMERLVLLNIDINKYTVIRGSEKTKAAITRLGISRLIETTTSDLRSSEDAIRHYLTHANFHRKKIESLYDSAMKLCPHSRDPQIRGCAACGFVYRPFSELPTYASAPASIVMSDE